LAKNRAPRNKTVTLTPAEEQLYRKTLVKISEPVETASILNKIINQDIIELAVLLPRNFVDLLIVDPPYNLNKSFGSATFRKKSLEHYGLWFENWFVKLLPLLKKNASVYVCCDWRSSTAVHLVLQKYLKLRNRITWEREKGRGSKNNWKNNSEDIWFATVSDDYTFNLDAVKLKRKVMAPYTDDNGRPKDWYETSRSRFRLTHPSNLWTDITVPFWSMPENTDHPTQKPEKLLAKLILASSNPGDLVFDPFAGVGSAPVAARKLGRYFVGVEIDTEYCLLAAKRLHLALRDTNIQGYRNGVFWERNTLGEQSKKHIESGGKNVIPHLQHA